MSGQSTTRMVNVNPERPDPDILDQAAAVMLRGGLVAFATETVYGLGAVATDSDSVARIFAAKGRPAVNPLIVHVGGIEEARECTAIWPDAAQVLASRFWPGPLSLVLYRSEVIPDLVTAGRETVAVRAPSGKVVQGLIERLGKPIAAPSANLANRITSTRAEHVLADLTGRVDLILDSGPTRIGLESTVLDLTTSPPRVLRPGPIGRVEIEAALSGDHVRACELSERPERPASPGQMPVHYAPRTPAFRVERRELLPGRMSENVAVILLGEPRELAGILPRRLFHLETPDTAAGSLYDVLHECDSLGAESILVVMPPDRPDWQAIRDRMLRATRPIGHAE
ncbi:MAG: L-threonylcarbamoyladenylate synthase [Isosphaeraceae bacterium]